MAKLTISDNDMAATRRIAAILKNIEENENNSQYVTIDWLKKRYPVF